MNQQFPDRLWYKQKIKNLTEKIPDTHEHCTKPNTFKQNEEMIKPLMILESLLLDVVFAMVSVMWPCCSVVIQEQHLFNVRSLCGSEGPLYQCEEQALPRHLGIRCQTHRLSEHPPTSSGPGRLCSPVVSSRGCKVLTPNQKLLCSI